MKGFTVESNTHFKFEVGVLLVEVLGGMNIHTFNRLKITIKVSHTKIPHYRPLRDQIDLYQDAQVSKITRRIAERFETGLAQTEKLIYGLVDALEEYRSEELQKEQTKPTGKLLTAIEVKGAEKFLKSKALLYAVKQQLTESGIVGEENNALILYLCMLSRKLNNPLSAICLAKSGTGKSYLMEKVAECITVEDKMEHTQLTENSLYYFNRHELNGKLFLVEDLDGASEALYPIRELQSKKRISKTVTLKDNQGNLRTKSLVVEGQVSIIGCTTKEQVYEDNANRSLLVHLDNSAIQDRRIMDYQKSVAAGLIDEMKEIKAKRTLENADRVLKRIKVVNPFAPMIDLPKEIFKTRRTMGLLLGFIETITYLHQFQRKKQVIEDTGEEFIESTLSDVEEAFELLKPVLFRKSDELNEVTRSFYEWLKTWEKSVSENGFTLHEVREEKRIAPRTLSRYLKVLQEYKKVRIVSGNKKVGFRYRIENETPSLFENIEKQIKEMLLNLRVSQPKATISK